MRLITLALTAALAGCASTAKYEARLSALMGSDELTLLRIFGPPSSAYDAGGSRFLTFGGPQGSVYLPGTGATATTTVYGKTAYTQFNPGMPPMAIQLSCITTFELRDDRAVSWRWQGNNCKSK